MKETATVAALLWLLVGCAPNETVASSTPPSNAPASRGGAPAAAVAPGAPSTDRSAAPAHLRPRVLATYPHDTSSYTQGLLWIDGKLYESKGQYAVSALRRVDLKSGSVELERRVPSEYFAEGLARVGDELVQLTWRAGVAMRYRLADLSPLREQRYSGEGWGLAFDGERLVLSDGTQLLRFLDPESLEEARRVEVRQQGVVRDELNELEWVDGALYANVYQTDEIVRIDASSGEVTAVIDASGLLTPEEQQRAEVLNGIAYRPETDTFLLTGKFWPKLFEVVFEPAP